MFNLPRKIFLTLSLSAFTVSAILQMLIRWSPRNNYWFWSRFTELKQRQDDLDVGHLLALSASRKTIHIIRKHRHKIENSLRSSLSTTYSTPSQFFFKFNKKFHIDLLLVFLPPIVVGTRKKHICTLISIEKVQLKRQKHVFILE